MLREVHPAQVLAEPQRRQASQAETVEVAAIRLPEAQPTVQAEQSQEAGALAEDRPPESSAQAGP